MKKVLLGVFLAITLSSFTACQKSDNDAGNNSVETEDTTQVETNEDSDTANNSITNTQDEACTEAESELFPIIQQIYEIKTPDLALGDIPVDLTNLDAVKYNTGLTDVSKIKEIAVSEAMIGSQAYSLVLVQVNQAKDAESIANEMLQGIDQRKWICVEANDLQVVAQEDVIMLFMVSSQLEDVVTSKEIVEAFKEVRGGELDIELAK